MQCLIIFINVSESLFEDVRILFVEHFVVAVAMHQACLVSGNLVDILDCLTFGDCIWTVVSYDESLP
jgi:hypothetical protein